MTSSPTTNIVGRPSIIEMVRVLAANSAMIANEPDPIKEITLEARVFDYVVHVEVSPMALYGAKRDGGRVDEFFYAGIKFNKGKES